MYYLQYIVTIKPFPGDFFSSEAVFHDSDTIPMKCDILTNRIAMAMRFIFTPLSAIIPWTGYRLLEKHSLFGATWQLESS